ncbi:MAG: hypothetical protein ABI200_07240 [Gaiellales bacterium]
MTTIMRGPSLTESTLATSTMVPDFAMQPATQVLERPQAAMPPTLVPATAPAAAVTGGGQVVSGAAQLNEPQLLAALTQLRDALVQLVSALQAQGGVQGGGAATAGTSHACCASLMQPGAAAAPAPPSPQILAPAPAVTAERPQVTQRVDPSSIKDKDSATGLTAASKRGLEEAHTYGLPLVSGKRSGSGTSDHIHGNAIDVSTLPIGAKSSSGGTSQMKAFAEHIREQGKAGNLNVKYVIADGRIASSKDNWSWRPYTSPGKSESSLAALKQSNQGEFNRIQHYDHVHVSFR